MAIDLISPTAVTFGHKDAVRVPVASRFDNLVLALKEALGPSSGLTSDDVNVDFLTRLMTDYDSQPAEWSKYAFGDASRGYTRNLVDEGNGKSNLVGVRCPSMPRLWVNMFVADRDAHSSSSCGLQARGARSMTTATPTAS